MALQSVHDAVHVHFGVVVAVFHQLQLVHRFFEEAEDTSAFLFVHGKALELGDQAADHVSHFAQVFGLHVFEGGIGKAGDLLLGRSAIGEYQIGVGDVDLGGKILDHLLLLGRKGRAHLLGLDRGLLLLGRLGGLLDLAGVQGQGDGRGYLGRFLYCLGYRLLRRGLYARGPRFHRQFDFV